MKQRFQRLRIVLRFDAHRHNDGIDARLLEIWIVDHGRLERLGRKAKMHNQSRRAANHVDPLLRQTPPVKAFANSSGMR